MIFGMIYLLREVTFDVDCAVGTEAGCWIKIIQTIHFGPWIEMTAVLALWVRSSRCGGERGLDGAWARQLQLENSLMPTLMVKK